MLLLLFLSSLLLLLVAVVILLTYKRIACACIAFYLASALATVATITAAYAYLCFHIHAVAVSGSAEWRECDAFSLFLMRRVHLPAALLLLVAVSYSAVASHFQLNSTSVFVHDAAMFPLRVATEWLSCVLLAVTSTPSLQNITQTMFSRCQHTLSYKANSIDSSKQHERAEKAAVASAASQRGEQQLSSCFMQT